MTKGPKVSEGDVIWRPSVDRVERARVTHFMRWLADEDVVGARTYHELWQWSVTDLSGFWGAVRRYFGVGIGDWAGPVLVRGQGAEGAEWFTGLDLNYVDTVFEHPDGDEALIAIGESGERVSLTYGALREAAGAVAGRLAQLGVGPGDRVAAVLTNSAAAVVGFLATASLGAVWSSCAPEFGVEGMLDRLAQISPKVLVATASYRYGGKTFDVSEKIARLEEGLDGLVATLSVDGPDGISLPAGRRVRRIAWDEVLAEPAPLVPVHVPFDHPLWIVYSSGTTGLPKPIVHGHGGIVLEHLKFLAFQMDVGPGERFFWFTTTGWIMWNILVGGLLTGATIVCYDGDPVWPDTGALWRLAASAGVTVFGAGAPYLEACRRSGAAVREVDRPTSVHTIGSTGAPLSPEGFAWAATEVGDDVLVGSTSGGTDVATSFLGPSPLLEVRAGELQGALLGVDVKAFDPSGRAVVDDVGELVVTQPMPSMPLYLWGDSDGKRLHETYFEPFAGVWRHGDWIRLNRSGGAVIYGRSDATLNRGGVRAGTAEYYRVVEALPEIADSLVVDTSELGRDGRIILLVVPARPDANSPDQPGAPPTSPDVDTLVRRTVREALSPRHVPDVVVSVPVLPRTITGKKLEVPIRRILLGSPIEGTVSTAALDRPEAFSAVVDRLVAAGLVGGQ